MNAPIIRRVRKHRDPAPSEIEHCDDVRDLGFVERVTLFLCGMKQETAAQLLEGFAAHQQRRAREFACAINAWDSPTRQGRLVRELGIRHDAISRLRSLMIESPVGLRRAICEAIPSRLAQHFPCVKTDESTSPAMRSLALRLVREAIR